jgi:hypothetical protein
MEHQPSGALEVVNSLFEQANTGEHDTAHEPESLQTSPRQPAPTDQERAFIVPYYFDEAGHRHVLFHRDANPTHEVRPISFWGTCMFSQPQELTIYWQERTHGTIPFTTRDCPNGIMALDLNTRIFFVLINPFNPDFLAHGGPLEHCVSIPLVALYQHHYPQDCVPEISQVFDAEEIHVILDFLGRRPQHAW